MAAQRARLRRAVALQLRARGMGFAGAYTAQANDPSAIFHNAAGIAFLKGKQIYLGGTFISPSSDFIGANPFPGAGVTETGAAGKIPVPSLYYTQEFSENVVVGLGVYSPFGLKTEWANPNTYSGRFLSQRAELKGVAINPTIAEAARYLVCPVSHVYGVVAVAAAPKRDAQMHLPLGRA